ncbi:MAG: ATP-binding protein, partial [Deltaproteobacteria bacterium]|nr:ATP-binding protein [Deltaproteobacteria bacterium]
TYEHREANYGAIRISLTKLGSDANWLHVCDNGIGMSKTVLTNFLLDFGRPFWGSKTMQEEFPGLLSSGIKQIGKYGIGFFAVFMVAEQVQVITRRSDAAAKDTIVLEFSNGLKGRPILRLAEDPEQLIDAGTQIHLKLTTDPFVEGGLLYDPYSEEIRSLADLCTELCPTLEVDLFLEENGSSRKLITAGDWRTMDSADFLKRLPVSRHCDKKKVEKEILKEIQRSAPNVRFLRNQEGNIIGRAFLSPGFHGTERSGFPLSGVVTIGGLESCLLFGISGALMGRPMRASRDVAQPLVDATELKRWAEEQATLVPALYDNPKSQSVCAQYIRQCGGDTGDLPICINAGNWCSIAEIRSRIDLPDQLVLLDDFTVEYEFSILDSYTLNDNVFITNTSSVSGMLQDNTCWPWRIDFTRRLSWETTDIRMTLGGALVEGIAQAWGVDVEILYKGNDRLLIHEEEVVVGSTGNRELKASAILLNKPQS